MSDGGLIDVADLGLASPTPGAGPTRPAAAPAATGEAAGLVEAIENLEREKILAALEACRFNKTRTAAYLGITFRALRYKLSKLEIE
jgi:two-component system response regulator PilR (NtrC family)